jgi:hypothetical protein
MKRTITIILLGILVAIPCLAQAPQTKPAESLPSVDQILTKYVEALGGKAALEKVTSRMQKGSLDIPAMGVGGPMETYEKAPNKSLTVIEISGFGTIQEGFDGTVAWAQDPQSGLREKTGSELIDTKLDSDIQKPLKLKQLYPTLTVTGKAKVGDKETYVVEAKPAAGTPEKWYFDVQTGLMIRLDTERESPQGKVPVENYMEDFRDVEGIKIPYILKITNPQFSVTVKVTEVKLNVPVDDAKFAKPKA